eukprot:1194539-Pyramimonas_sp.AAC.1
MFPSFSQSEFKRQHIESRSARSPSLLKRGEDGRGAGLSPVPSSAPSRSCQGARDAPTGGWRERSRRSPR